MKIKAIAPYPPRKWTHIDCARAKNLANQGGDGSARAPEVLIVNGPSLAGGEWCG